MNIIIWWQKKRSYFLQIRTWSAIIEDKHALKVKKKKNNRMRMILSMRSVLFTNQFSKTIYFVTILQYPLLLKQRSRKMH